ncbi:hypothetical protein K474DRAFT_1603722 [Panus rudis PR-1116 ss-1]|nr:hypothetical protein K474DRAFT_1603722 [Panus rudis PR-1116 ss-1]
MPTSIASEPSSPSPIPCRRDFHFSRLFPGDNLRECLARHEHYLCAKLSLKPGLSILLVGSGCGDLALELVRFSNVYVRGIDADREKVCSCFHPTRRSRCNSLTQNDFLAPEYASGCLPQGIVSERYDVVCAVEALRNFGSIYDSLASVLKPGGKLGIFEWCWSTRFNIHDADHCRLAGVLESAAGLRSRAPYQRSVNCALQSLRYSGLRIVSYEDLSERPDDIPWYHVLENALGDSEFPWSTNHLTDEVVPFGALSRPAASILLEAGKLKLFTPMALIIAERPHE